MPRQSEDQYYEMLAQRLAALLIAQYDRRYGDDRVDAAVKDDDKSRREDGGPRGVEQRLDVRERRPS